MDINREDRPPTQDDPPPFMGTWNKIYAAILVYTCALILILYLITIKLNH
jgi:hypothetical protein